VQGGLRKVEIASSSDRSLRGYRCLTRRAPAHGAKPREAERHHSPGGGFRDRTPQGEDTIAFDRSQVGTQIDDAITAYALGENVDAVGDDANKATADHTKGQIAPETEIERRTTPSTPSNCGPSRIAVPKILSSGPSRASATLLALPIRVVA
jgi:hypothetical protein